MRATSAFRDDSADMLRGQSHHPLYPSCSTNPWPLGFFCNANTSEGFNPSKDASFPKINLRTSEVPPLGGDRPSTRALLAFFAGGLHGHIRYLLLNEWKGKDQDVQVYDELPKGVSYDKKMKSSKFCLCPSGYEVASPRVVEAIYADCVPVLISEFRCLCSAFQ